MSKKKIIHDEKTDKMLNAVKALISDIVKQVMREMIIDDISVSYDKKSKAMNISFKEPS